MREKPWDKIYAEADTRESEEKIKKNFKNAEIPEMYDVEYLEKNDFEKQAEIEALGALNIFLTKLGLSSPKFGAENIHVVSPEDYEKEIKNHPQESGRTLFRQIYVQRRSNKATFLADLTHEMAHAASATFLKVTQKRDNGGLINNIMLRRSGLLFRPKSGVENFDGLNEAVTEIVALITRNILSQRTNILTDQEKNELTNYATYMPLILLTEGLIDLAAGSPDKINETQDELCRNYISGTYSFLQKLEKKKPGANKLLIKMGSEPEDALEVAETLGLTEVAESIKKILE